MKEKAICTKERGICTNDLATCTKEKGSCTNVLGSCALGISSVSFLFLSVSLNAKKAFGVERPTMHFDKLNVQDDSRNALILIVE